LANAIEPSVCAGDAALSQITLAIFAIFSKHEFQRLFCFQRYLLIFLNYSAWNLYKLILTNVNSLMQFLNEKARSFMPSNAFSLKS